MLTSIANNFGEILLAVLGIIGACLAYQAQKHAREANKAVNGNKDKSATRLYDLVVGIDTRTDRLETWMSHHKIESNERDDRLDRLDRDIIAKIEEYGCPVRLQQRKTPLCQDDSVVD
jgi:hypothetical protein